MCCWKSIGTNSYVLRIFFEYTTWPSQQRLAYPTLQKCAMLSRHFQFAQGKTNLSISSDIKKDRKTPFGVYAAKRNIQRQFTNGYTHPISAEITQAKYAFAVCDHYCLQSKPVSYRNINNKIIIWILVALTMATAMKEVSCTQADHKRRTTLMMVAWLILPFATSCSIRQCGVTQKNLKFNFTRFIINRMFKWNMPTLTSCSGQLLSMR